MDWKRKREEFHLSQKDVAEILGVTVEEVQSWENGKPITEEQEYSLRVLFRCKIPSKPVFTPIACPRCQSKNLAYVAEAHKCIGARVFLLFVSTIFLIVGFFALKDPNGQGPTLFICLIVMLSIQLYIFASESRTHVKCVCKDCGNTWVHD